MTQPKETDMNNVNEIDTQNEVIHLGAVSIETKRHGFETEVMSLGDIPFSGISEECATGAPVGAPSLFLPVMSSQLLEYMNSFYTGRHILFIVLRNYHSLLLSP